MAPPQFKVIIAGGGIAGLALGVMLERAGIDYLILEAAKDVQPLGTLMYLGPAVLRTFEQLGLLEDLVRHSNVMTGCTLLDHSLNKICRISVDYVKDRYGYDTILIARPKLYDILLSRIPAYKVLFDKRVSSTIQASEGIKVRCKDGSAYNGDILVAADGGASSIRKAMYDHARKRSKKILHPADYAPSKLDQRCIVGVTEPLSVNQFPILASKNCELVLVIPKEPKRSIWFIPMAEHRFGWGVTSHFPCPEPSNYKESLDGQSSIDSDHEAEGTSSSAHTTTQLSAASYDSPGSMYSMSDLSPDSIGNSSSISNNSQFTAQSIKRKQSTGRLSKHSTGSSKIQQPKATHEYPPVLQPNDPSLMELKDLPQDRIWGKLDERYNIEDSIREQACPFGGTLGDLIDVTSRKMISMVVVEEKFYRTWHYGRTVLLGDACHKVLPSSGHGTTQGILDAISLASLLSELPTNSLTDIEALFRVHYERRGPIAKAAVIVSQQQAHMVFNNKLSGKIMRSTASHWLSSWFRIKWTDRLFESRPILPFLKFVPDRGSFKDKDKNIPLLQDRRFEIARRKSISSGYLSRDTGSIKLKGERSGPGGAKNDGDYVAEEVEMEFGPSVFSTSMPSIIMPPSISSMPMTRPMSSMMDIEGTLIPMISKPAIKENDTVRRRHSHWHLYRD
ncbi:hypothetical protein EDD11_002570 [Mortierella claussenii]|nr:hypothetical protein EDD11_002570 [Mortierella claussenii]